MTPAPSSRADPRVSNTQTLVFVYGTLKCGFVNEAAMRGVSSVEVNRVRKALVRGVTLYHLPNPGRPYAYPALRRGAGMALGELHALESEDALMVLDHLELEGFEYHRRRCWAILRGERVRAWVYVYASSARLHAQGARRYARVWWSGHLRSRER
jgi:gamma-glutamylcyclotransferase (GGCT)/AIG2-like uncharacterized protein YtfP